MPSSASHAAISPSTIDALGAAAREPRRLLRTAHFGVVSFRRDHGGAIVSCAAMEVSNGDIAWRCARAAASHHGNVGAVGFRDGVVFARFGDVDLDVLAG